MNIQENFQEVNAVTTHNEAIPPINNKKIIVANGKAGISARFWDWGVCTQKEYNDFKNVGTNWVKSNCEKYLTMEQRELLDN